MSDDEIVAFMKRHGIVRYKQLDDHAVLIELDPRFLDPPMKDPVQAVAEESAKGRDLTFGDRCACGHYRDVEHSPSGCLRGCSPDLCVVKESHDG